MNVTVEPFTGVALIAMFVPFFDTAIGLVFMLPTDPFTGNVTWLVLAAPGSPFIGTSEGICSLIGVAAFAAPFGSFTGDPFKKFEYCVASIVIIFGFLTIVTLCNVMILLLKLICTLCGG